MIIPLPYKSGDVISLKLTTGEELIAKYISESDSVYEVSKPLTLVPAPQGMAMTQSMFSVDIKNTHVKINKHTVVCHGKTIKAFSDEYTRGTTGIQPVTGGAGLISG